MGTLSHLSIQEPTEPITAKVKNTLYNTTSEVTSNTITVSGGSPTGGGGDSDIDKDGGIDIIFLI